MKTFAKATAILGLVGAFSAAAFAQTPPAPPMAGGATTPAKGTMVKGYTRKGKNGNMITVKPHLRAAKTPTTGTKGGMVKGYTRKTKSGKIVAVKGYTRTAPKKPSMTTPSANPGKM